MTIPVYTPAEARDRETFLALMWSLSYPGRRHRLPQGGLRTIGHALLDLETSFYTPDAALARELLRTGARHLSPEAAAYHFYPVCDETALASIRQASVGTLLYPDTAATLVIEAPLSGGDTYTLTGPGIQQRALLSAVLPASLWQMRAASRFPLGWDVFIVSGDEVVGLPRSTQMEA